MVERISALHGHYSEGRFGEPGDVGVTLSEVPDLVLHQIAVWPETVETAAGVVAEIVAADIAPGPCAAREGTRGVLLRVEPLKWWLYGASAATITSDVGMTLDLSHSRTHLRVDGPKAQLCLNRLVPIDLRDLKFPPGTVGSTTMHHVGVTIWRSDHGYEVFVPRGFALSLWQVLFDTALQFGLEVLIAPRTDD